MTTVPAPARTLYVAEPVLWFRVLLLCIGVALVLLIGGSSLALLLAEGGPGPLGAAALIVTVPATLLIVALIALGLRSRFSVTTHGIEILNGIRTHRLAWQEVAVVDVDHGWAHQGQTLVVLHGGRQIGAPITAARSAMRRGEHSRDHGLDFRSPARPTKAAMDAHRRWLRGEFEAR